MLTRGVLHWVLLEVYELLVMQASKPANLHWLVCLVASELPCIGWLEG